MKKVDLQIENARIPFGGTVIKAGIAIDGEKIAAISKNRLLPEADESLNLDGSLLLPGIVDPHVHFRDPGLTEKEDFCTGSKAAAAGGVTTVCDMPNTIPPTDSLMAFKEKVKIAEKKSYVDFGLHAALPREVDEGEKIARSGAVSFKLYPEIREDAVVKDFEEIGLTVSIHPEDPRLLKEKKNLERDIQNFIRSRPRRSEISEISRLLKITSHVHLHFCHITLQESLNLIAKAERRRKITCEVTPHHLLLSIRDLKELGTIGKTFPPLRTDGDKRTLLNALQMGGIDVIATDHAPHTLEEKEMNIWKAPAGIAGIETSLPLIFTLVQKGKLSLFRLIETMCKNPARIFGLRNERGVLKGTMLPGGDADFVALDPKEEWKIKENDLHGKSKFTPFENWKVIGKPLLTLVRGHPVFEGGEIVGKEGQGRFIPRGAQVEGTAD